MPARDYYNRLYAAAGQVLNASFTDDTTEAMAKSHAFVSDLEAWLNALGARREAAALRAATREYQFSLLALSLGSYRSAFTALRLFLELALATVNWSVNERELREWERATRDLNWTILIDNENGVFSKQFLRLFTPGFADEAGPYRASAAAVYRECSEYIHGNSATNSALPQTLAFDKSLFDSWHNKAAAMRLATTFCLAARYVPDLAPADRTALESTLMDHIGHSPTLRQLLGAPVEDANG